MGTWSVPERIGDLVQVNSDIRKLNLMCHNWNVEDVIGDDELFDNIYKVIERLAEMRDYQLEKHNIVTSIRAIDCPDKDCRESFDHEGELFSHLITEHGYTKPKAVKNVVVQLKSL